MVSLLLLLSSVVVAQIPDESSLRTFDGGFPFTTRYPSALVVETGASDEGISATFSETAGAEASIHVRFYSRPMPKVAEVRSLVTSKDGLLDYDGWTLRERSTDVARQYPWAVERLEFVATKQSQRGYIGDVVIGKYKRAGFYVITFYPAVDRERWQAYQQTIFAHFRLN